MKRPNRWERYGDGRRPPRERLLTNVLLSLTNEQEVAEELYLTIEFLRKDLSKLRLETLALLEDALTPGGGCRPSRHPEGPCYS